jgi:hypothetical protein
MSISTLIYSMSGCGGASESVHNADIYVGLNPARRGGPASTSRMPVLHMSM